jgi:antitoxin component YwqK of YwqJK toxin-antitoxin module
MRIPDYLFLLVLIAFLSSPFNGKAQQFLIDNGDTINRLSADSVRSGLWREYYSTGHIKSEVYFTNGKRDGLEITWYNIPHCIQTETTYKMGEMDGPVKKYSRWCNLEREEYYSGGKENGYRREFYSDGKLKAEGEFIEGEMRGHFKVFDKKGRFSYESKTTDTEIALADTVPPLPEEGVGRMLDVKANHSNKLFVVDITGSMYPHAKKLITWFDQHLKFNQEDLCFVAFNDGDRKPEPAKIIGSTGGVYFAETNRLENLILLLKTTSQKGGGGDAPENNIEAILKGIKKFPKTSEVWMIADNDAPVKDIELFKKVNKPVHIIVCTSYKKYSVFEDYVLLAWYTKGSIHTFDKDLIDFKDASDNKVYDIGGTSYLIMNNRVRKVGK